MITGITMTELNEQDPAFVDSPEKENILEIDGVKYIQLDDSYAQTQKSYQPKRRYAEKTVRGVVVGRGENKQIIPVEEVRKLAALHCSYSDLAAYFGVNESTFRDHFRSEVERAREKTKHRLMEAMLENAIVRHNPAVQIFLSKNLLGLVNDPVSQEGITPLPWLDGE